MRTGRFVAAALAAVISACTVAEKEETTADTASTAQEPPTIETLKAPVADADIKWEEWAPAGTADAKLDWPAGAVSAGGTLYFVGTRKLKRPARNPGLRAEIVFDRITPGGIEEAAAYPGYFGERADAAVAASPDGRLWFVGGMYTPPPMKLAPDERLDFTELGTALGEVYVWNPATKDLKLETYLPVPRGKARTIFAGGELYVVGGTYDPADADDENNRQVHRYDARDGMWTKFHEIPVPLAQPAAAVAQAGLYVIGGKQLKPAYVSNGVFRYDLTVYKWQTGPQLPAPRAAAGAYVVDGYIYVIGGCEAEGYAAPPRMGLKSYRFDVRGKRWEELASPLPEGCSFSAFDGRYFYLVGADKTYRGYIVKTKS